MSQLPRLFSRLSALPSRLRYSTPVVSEATGAPSRTTPASSFDNITDLDDLIDSIGLDVHDKNKGLSFARMLRESKLMQLGDMDGRVVIGKVVHRMQDDLYIDMGLKFNAVCKAPAVNGEDYHVGSRVLVRLHDAELSERFLGSRRDLTLLEADATLIRLLRSGPRKQTKPADTPIPTKTVEEGSS